LFHITDFTRAVLYFILKKQGIKFTSKQIPNTDSKNKKIRQIRQVIPVIGLYAFTMIKKTNMVADNTTPIIHANFFEQLLHIQVF